MRYVSLSIVLAASLSGCATGPAVNWKEWRDSVTITYKASADIPDRANGASLEVWQDHPTYILYGKDGAAIKMPSNVGKGLRRLPDGTVVLE